MRVILVDDEFMARCVLEEAVEAVLPDVETVSFSGPSKALEYARENPVDIAFLDINMRTMSGIEMARELQKLNPQINIIFCTGYEEYALDAIRLHCSEYLVKPITEEKVKEAIMNLRFPVKEEKRVRFHCFGDFEVYCDGNPMEFSFNRTKELLAYLVDRDGVNVSTQEIMAGAFEDSISRPYFSQLRKDLISTFERYGVSEVLRISRSQMGIEREQVACDYYDYLDGKNSKKPSEYMTQYSFGELTLGGLM